MDGDDERDAVVELREDAAEVGLPGVAVDDLGIDGSGVEVEAALESTEGGLEFFRRGPVGGVQTESTRGGIRGGAVLIAEAAHLHRHEFGEFAAEVFHMHAGAAIDVGGVFVGKEQGFPRVLEKFRREGEFQCSGAVIEPRGIDGSEGGFADREIAGLGQAEKMAHGGAEIGFMADEQHRGFGGQ